MRAAPALVGRRSPHARFTKLPPVPRPRRARRRFLRRGRAGEVSASTSCATATSAGPSASGLGTLTDAEWLDHFAPLRAPARQLSDAAGAALPRPPVPHLQSRSRRRARLPLRADARPRGRPPARPRHQGQRPHALVAHRRRPPDAEGRRARSAGHRDAGGARRRHVENLQPDRNRRGPDARRRALADPLLGAGPAQPFAHPHRQLPAPALSSTSTTTSAKLLDYTIRTYMPDTLARRCRRTRAGLPRRGLPPRRRDRRRLDARRLRPRRAQHRQHQRHRRKLRLRPVALPAGARPGLHRRLFRRDRPLRLWPPARHAAVEPDAAGRMPAAAWPDKSKLEDVLRGFEPHFHRAFNAAMLRRLGLQPAGEEADDRARALGLEIPDRHEDAVRAVLLRLVWRHGEREARGGEPVSRILRGGEFRAGICDHRRARDGARHQPRPRIFRARKTLHHADRRGRGAVGADRRQRRLVGLPRQARRHRARCARPIRSRLRLSLPAPPAAPRSGASRSPGGGRSRCASPSDAASGTAA